MVKRSAPIHHRLELLWRRSSKSMGLPIGPSSLEFHRDGPSWRGSIYQKPIGGLKFKRLRALLKKDVERTA